MLSFFKKRESKKIDKSFNDIKDKIKHEIINDTLYIARNEYTVMPRFSYHQPTDYHLNSYPVDFKPAVYLPGVELPLPPGQTRMGYSTDDTIYLTSGKNDHDVIKNFINKYHKEKKITLLDMGCSSGRVLRHFYEEYKNDNWELNGCDIQAMPIEWLRINFPKEFNVFTNCTIPHLPFADASLDVIYGISVFTHIKYLWDMWLMELKRVLKPGGLLIQTIHSETAWDFYYKHRDEEWVRKAHSHEMLEHPSMQHSWFHYGDICCSQSFYKKETAKEYWGRYFDIKEIAPPQDEFNFQDWVVCQK